LRAFAKRFTRNKFGPFELLKKNLPGNVKRLHFHQLFMTLLYNTFCDTGVPHKNM
jgi:hypothetical protein